eukprot:SAG11_NODE_206_length_12389_cov_11.831192_3_plen_196_part_00
MPCCCRRSNAQVAPIPPLAEHSSWHETERDRFEAAAAVLRILGERLEELGGFHEEGIFRIPGDVQVVSRLQEQLRAGEEAGAVVQSCEDAKCIAMLLMRWLRDLEPAMIEPSLYERWYVACWLNSHVPAIIVSHLSDPFCHRASLSKLSLEPERRDASAAAVEKLVRAVRQPWQQLMRQLVSILQHVNPESSRMT